MSIIQDIAAGKYDDELEVIETAISTRKHRVAYSTIGVGDTVEFTGGRQYMIGLQAKVKERLTKRYRLEIVPKDRIYAKRFGLGSFVCPPDLFRKVG